MIGRRRLIGWLCGVLSVGCGSDLIGVDAQVVADALGDATAIDVDGDLAPDAVVDVADDGRRETRDVTLADTALDVDDRDLVSVDAPDATSTDGMVADVGEDARPPDVLPTDRPAVDAVLSDHPPADVLALDATRDAPAADATRDASVLGDTASGVDAVTAMDVAPRDAPLSDLGPNDAGADAARDSAAVDVACAGPAPAVSVTSPTAAQAIETCSVSESPVYFDFVAAVTASASVVSVGARWITPDGAEAPPPATRFAAPYAFRRQVGGPSSAVPPLSVFGLRGTWRVEFTALDACGRRSTASQSFSLIYTPRRCPNP